MLNAVKSGALRNENKKHAKLQKFMQIALNILSLLAVKLLLEGADFQ